MYFQFEVTVLLDKQHNKKSISYLAFSCTSKCRVMTICLLNVTEKIT